MKSFMSSNCTYFETEQKSPQAQVNSFKLQPYDSMYDRFKQVLRKGDPVLIHLMLKQASHVKNKRLSRKMLKTLVQHAALPYSE